MASIIKTLDNNGKIEDKAIYTLDPDSALVAYLEQTINKNYHTWDYDKSKFKNLIKAAKSGKGYIYDNGTLCICAYEKQLKNNC